MLGVGLFAMFRALTFMQYQDVLFLATLLVRELLQFSITRTTSYFKNETAQRPWQLPTWLADPTEDLEEPIEHIHSCNWPQLMQPG